MITDPHEYFTHGCGRCNQFKTPSCTVHKWSAGLAELRRICLQAGLSETAKWGHPCYQFAGRNIALIGAFRDDVRITFFNAGLMQDPENLLERPGPNSQIKSLIRFKDSVEVKEQAPLITAYLHESIGYARAGIRPAKVILPLDLPGELSDALDSDPEYAEAFQALTPGRQRSYVIHLASAKKPETRIARIARFRAKVIAGKGANER